MWEKIKESPDRVGSDLVTSDRLRIPTGWIVRTTISKGNGVPGCHSSMIEVTDLNHDWKLE